MMLSLLLLVITLHWAFMFGVHLALNTKIKTYQLCLFIIVVKLFLMSYGYK